ncbi:hypothetical protein HZS_549 [Henneguya salminicola]|nr:hypothetical protein HZS_549 [Henneguya salminicola]
MFGYSYLDLLNRSFIRTEEAKMRTFPSMRKNEQAANRKRDVNYEYKLHDKVYIKAVQKDKLDSRYDGPYDVVNCGWTIGYW